MIDGKYRVKIVVLEASDLLAKSNGIIDKINVFGFSGKGDVVDPLLKITCTADAPPQSTKKRVQSTSPIFNETFFFLFDNRQQEDLRAATIQFTLFNRKSFIQRDAIIGIHEIDWTYIYFQPHHEVYNAWLSLTDPTDEVEGVTGYIKVNIAVLGPADELFVHDINDQTLQNDAGLNKSILSTKVKQIPHQLEIDIFRAECLAPLDLASETVDPYVRCSYSGISLQTRALESTCNPVWNQRIRLQCTFPCQSKFLSLELWDRDLLSRDDLIGRLDLPIAEFLKTEDPVLYWANIYGPPMSASDSETARYMTVHGSTVGSHFRGRLLYKVRQYSCPLPVSDVLDLPYAFPEQPMSSIRTRSYCLRVDVLEGNQLPMRKQAMVHVSFGPYCMTSKVAPMANGRAEWYERLQEIKVVFPDDVLFLPDIIVYFADAATESRRHAYHRICARHVLVDESNAETQRDKLNDPYMLKLKEDRSLDLVRDVEFPGFLFIRAALFSIKPWERPKLLKHKVPYLKYELRVLVFIGRDFPPSDQNGSADPFLQVQCAGQQAYSTVCPKTLNPGWFQNIILDVDLPDYDAIQNDDTLETFIPSGFSLVVFDDNTPPQEEEELAKQKDSLKVKVDQRERNRELIGRQWVSIVNHKKDIAKLQAIFRPPSLQDNSDEKQEQEEIHIFQKKPKWQNIIYDATGEIKGKVLLGFVLVRKEHAFKIPTSENLYPEYVREQMQMYCIGLRNLDMTCLGQDAARQSLCVEFDVSGDKYVGMRSEDRFIKDDGVNINKILTVNVDVFQHDALQCVMDVLLYQNAVVEEQNQNQSAKNRVKLAMEELGVTVQQFLGKHGIAIGDKAKEAINKNEAQLTQTQILSKKQTPMKKQQSDQRKLIGMGSIKIYEQYIIKFIKRVPDNTTRIKMSKKQNLSSTAQAHNYSHTLNHGKIIDPQFDENHLLHLGALQNLHVPKEFPLKDVVLSDRVFNKRIADIIMEGEANMNHYSFLQESHQKKKSKQKKQEKQEITHSNISNSSLLTTINLNKINNDDMNLTNPNNNDKTNNNNNEKDTRNENKNQVNSIDLENQNENINDYLKVSAKTIQIPNESVQKEEKSLMFRKNVLFAMDESSQKNQLKYKMADKKENENQIKQINTFDDSTFNSSQVKQSDKKLIHENQKLIVTSLTIQKDQCISDASTVQSNAIEFKENFGDINIAQQPAEIKNEVKTVNLKTRMLNLFKGPYTSIMHLTKKQKYEMNSRETYEDFDTDPDEDLQLVPEWRQDREVYNDDLEHVMDMEGWMRKFVIRAGRTRGGDAGSSRYHLKNIQQQQSSHEIAVLKCIFLPSAAKDSPELFKKQVQQDVQKKLGLITQLMVEQAYIARVYVLAGHDIKGQHKKTDPYLKVSSGMNFNVDDKKRTLRPNTNNPGFYVSYDVPIELPGSAFLKIEVWDQETTLKDQMIGYTEIDMEDRYFSRDWNEYAKKPVEMRNLVGEYGGGTQGQLECWVELHPKCSVRNVPALKVAPPAEMKFELRVIVWETKNCVFKDPIEKCNDVYVRGKVATAGDFKETDVHWRCRSTGSFNWRWKFPLKCSALPQEKDYGNDKFIVQVYDKDIIGKDELIGEATIDLNTHNIIKKALARNTRDPDHAKGVCMQQLVTRAPGEPQSQTDRIWFDVFNPNFLDASGEKLSQGQVKLSFELISEKLAAEQANGNGRDAPNQFPTLAEPVGRFKFNIAHPLDMLKEIIGPDLYRKIWQMALTVLCIVFLLFILWILLSQALALKIVNII